MKKYKQIKLKNKQSKNFNNKMGIYNSNGVYYTFFDYTHDKFREGLGYFLGKGNSIEECLVNSLKNLNLRMVKMAKKLEREKKDIYEIWYGNPKKNENFTFWTIDGQPFIGDKEEN